MEKYKCEICGKNHTVYRSLKAPLPRLILEIPEKERKRRVKESEPFCSLDKITFFINGYVNIDLKDHKSPFFYWKVWASISKEDFFKQLDQLRDGKIIQLEGVLENELPFYTSSRGMNVDVLVQGGDEDLIVEFKIKEENELKHDQLNQIGKERVIEIMQTLHHSSIGEEQKFETPFSDRLRSELLEVEKKYLKKGKDFIINISTEMVLFQIISNQMLETNRTTGIGFGIHLSFDESNDEDYDEMTVFKEKDFSKQFDYHYLEGIPIYQIDLGKDKKHLEELSKKLLIEVYQVDLDTIAIDSFEM